MGACYSKGGQEASLSPKNKTPHKKPKNGLAIKIEYSPVKEHEDDRFSQLVDTNLEKSGDDNVTNGDNVQSSESIPVGKEDKSEIPFIDKTLEELKEDVCVATSDSGIESLPPNEGEGSIEMSSSHTDNIKPKMNNENDDQGIHCTCGAQKRSSLNYDPQTKVKCDTAPATPEKDSKKVLRRQDSRASAVSCENVILDMSKRSSREIRHFDSEASLDLGELPSAFQSLQDVKTMQMDGKEVVVIDAELYQQVLEELATLKYKLSQLTDLIQLQSISGEDSCSYTENQESTPVNSPKIRTSLNFSKS